jgi:hypothetical protein
MTDLRTASQQVLEALGKWSTGRDMDAVELNDLIATLEAALEQPEQATGKESLPVGQGAEGGWQSAPSPQVTQRMADMPMSEYRRGVNDGFKLGMREGRIKAEDEMREQPNECRWLQEGDEESDTWAASCGRHRYFSLNEGTPKDNHMKHCCYCGKPLVEVPIEEDEA